MRSILLGYAIGGMAMFGLMLFGRGNALSVKGRDVLWALALIAGAVWPLTLLMMLLGRVFRKQIVQTLKGGVKLSGKYMEDDQ